MPYLRHNFFLKEKPHRLDIFFYTGIEQSHFAGIIIKDTLIKT